MAFDLKEATLDGVTGEGFAVVLGQGEQQRCEGRIVFDQDPGPDVMKAIVDGSQLTYEGPVYHGDEEYHKSIPVRSRKADFDVDRPYVDFETIASRDDSGRGQRRRQGRQESGADRRGQGKGPAQGGIGDVTVHKK